MVRTWRAWVIEFRNGSFFQNLEADNGGPVRTAQRFSSRAEADKFMRKHEWILFNGGMEIDIRVTEHIENGWLTGRMVETIGREGNPTKWLIQEYDPEGKVINELFWM